MKIVGIMPVRNEDWILGFSARAALQWVDELVILDHASTDGSLAICEEIRTELSGYHWNRLSVLQETDAKWDEMTHRQRLLEAARERGASHVAIIDADEVVTANLIGNALREVIELSGWFESSPPCILQLPGYNLRRGLRSYHASGVWSNRWFSTVFRDRPELHWKGDRFHHREPMGVTLDAWRPILHGWGGVLHFWGASERRLRAKHAYYKVTERLRFPAKRVQEINAQYSLAVYGRPGDAAAQWIYKAVPDAWLAGYEPILKYLDIDREPWQENEVRRLVAEQGKPFFAGLDLFGLA